MGHATYYAEANIVCILFLTIIHHQLNKVSDKDLQQVMFSNVLNCLNAYFLSDIFWILVKENYIECSISGKYISNIVPFILIILASFLWFLYVEAVMNNNIARQPKLLIPAAIPFIIASAFIVSAPYTGFVFDINAVGNFSYTSFYHILMIVPSLYLLMSSIAAGRMIRKKGRYNNYNRNRAFVFFPVAPIIAGYLQTIFTTAPILCYIMTIGITYVYISVIQGMITIDTLTQTNNRSLMFKYLSSKMRTHEEGLSLFTLIIDIDSLENINSNFGRDEGDKALKKVADAIKEACSSQRSRFFVSRYGGDAFIVIAEVEYKAEASWLADKIKSNVRLIGEHSNLPYKLSVSIGIAGYDYMEPITPSALIARADTNLQKNKASAS